MNSIPWMILANREMGKQGEQREQGEQGKQGEIFNKEMI